MFTEVNGVKVMNEYNEKTAVRGAHIEKKQNHHIQQLVIQLINSRRSK